MALLNFGNSNVPSTLAERLEQLHLPTQTSNQAQPRAGLGAPVNFILRNLSENPFIHRIDTERDSVSIQTHTTILTNTSSESQEFLNTTSATSQEVAQKIIKFASDMFALEVGLGNADEFMLDNLPPDVKYNEYIESIVPKLEQSLVKRLAVDIGIDLFACPEITSESKTQPSGDLVSRLLAAYANNKGGSK